MKLLIFCSTNYCMSARDFAWLEWLYSRHKFDCIVTTWDRRYDVNLEIFTESYGLDWECAHTASEAVKIADCGAMLPGHDMHAAEIAILMHKAKKPVGQLKE